ncbi:hypothetical protein I6J22_05680 [Corynebacterium kroppenstedtii]|uniref:hypothetical protein n=1 Tax=Corynebacterium kroppenstedtii TaxID=161879 RepID=UPI0011D12BB3|nr:hypothetical protein [Corynebacterium kroppenstedtii]QRP09762.1 hypothetical protein I6J22_05680 [Corynebacterium kroppenstedtii]
MSVLRPKVNLAGDPTTPPTEELADQSARTNQRHITPSVPTMTEEHRQQVRHPADTALSQGLTPQRLIQ